MPKQESPVPPSLLNCPVSGYDVVGLLLTEEKATCPECGTTIDINTLRGSKPLRLRGWWQILLLSVAGVLNFVFWAANAASHTALVDAMIVWGVVALIGPLLLTVRVILPHWRASPQERSKLLVRAVGHLLLVWFSTALLVLIGSPAVIRYLLSGIRV